MLIVIDITTTKMRYEEIPNKIDENIIWELHEMGLTDQPQGAFAIGSTCAKKLLGDKLNFYLWY